MAECNQLNGEYAYGSEGILTISVGTSLLAACPEGSPADEFLACLPGEKTVLTDGNELSINRIDENGGAISLLFQLAE